MKTLFTDLGDVIIFYDGDGFCRLLGNYCPVDQKTLRRVMRIHLHHAHVGRIGSGKMVERIMRDCGFVGTRTDFIRIFHVFWRLNQKYVSFLKEWKQQGNELYLISNIQRMSWEHCNITYPDVWTLFDGLFLSYRMGLVKPNKAIYERALKKAGAVPSDAIFVDDRMENVEAAGRLGMAAWCYREETHADFVTFIMNVVSIQERKGGTV